MSQVLPEPIQFGKYTLFERIGRGGMADVYKGRIQGPAGFERVFVVKRILSHLSDDPAFINMFVEEAKLSARLNHPNIVQIFELGAVEGEYFISMEHIAGHDLSHTMKALWKAWGPPRPDLVAFIGREMCRALAYAHGICDDQGRPLGMIHRDVSPSNVMLSYEGAVKLLDFGIAKALGDGNENTNSGSNGGTLKGKYAYMAPEQTRGNDVDHRIDIFAAGIVLHEMLTGKRLFKGADDMQTIERVRRCEIRPASQLNPAVPPELDAILFRALARDPNDRFQTAAEMADALDGVVHAAHFTPQHMAAILRELDGDTGASAALEKRLTSSTVSVSTLRTATIPPVTLSTPRGTGHFPPITDMAPDAQALQGIMPRPLWKRASVWMVVLLCGGGIGLAVTKGAGVLPSGGSAATAATAATASPSPAAATRPPKRPKPVSVLVQSDPEGAEIFVAGKFESVGRTPAWITVEMDKDNPARLMLRKNGFQDKAMAIDVERPPMVTMLPTGATDPTTAAATPTDAPGADATKHGTTARRTRH